MNKQIISPEKIANFCRDIFKKYCNSNDIQITNDDNYPERYYLQSKKTTRIAISTYKRNVPIIQLKDNFWIYFGIQFQKMDNSAKSKKYYVKGVSLQLFEEDRLFCRAEWDNKDSTETEHPQPHWHVEPIIHNTQNSSIDNFITYMNLNSKENKEGGFIDFLNESPKDINLHLENFHYAMSSEWHNNNNSIIEITEQGLKCWLSNCLNNICIQLSHIK